MGFLYEPRLIKDADLPFTFKKITVYSERDAYKNTINTIFDGMEDRADKVIRENAIVNVINWHENVEILYFVQGEGTVRNGAAMYEVAAGDIAVISSNSLHCVYTDTCIGYYVLIVDKDFLLQNSIDSGSLLFKTIVKDEKTIEYFVDVAEAYARESKFAVAAIRVAILKLFLHLVTHQLDEDVTHKKKINNHIIEAIEYIDYHLNTSLNLDELAAILGYSKYHLAREFKKNVGYTIVTYVNLMRCNLAKIYLCQKNCSVIEVAEKCGFNNAPHFSKTFRAYIGMSPRDYIKKSKAAKTQKA